MRWQCDIIFYPIWIYFFSEYYWYSILFSLYFLSFGYQNYMYIGHLLFDDNKTAMLSRPSSYAWSESGM